MNNESLKLSSKMKLNKALILILMFSTALISGCKTTDVSVERGNGYTYRVGYPEIRLSAIGIITEEDIPTVSTATEILYESLIFKRVNNQRLAELYLEMRIINRESGLTISHNETFTILDPDTVIINELDSFQYKRIFEVTPGEYDVVVTVTDNNSLKDTSLGTEVFLPDPIKPEINLTNVLLLSKDNNALDDSYFPVTTYDVPQRMDSIRFEFQATNNDSRSPILIRAKLISFESDTLPARPMSNNDYLSGSLPMKGVDFREKTEIASSTRSLNQSGSVFIEFTFPTPLRGNYRFEITTSDENGDEIIKARDFSVKSENYPSISSIREVAAPLAYLMSSKDHRKMMQINDPTELKNAVDKFWLQNIKNPNIAREVIQKYYDRVEEANKLFSSFKEGWKTDQGMIYILFGNPWYVNENLWNQYWSYSYDLNDFNTNFRFFVPRKQSKFFPFTHLVLDRNNNYFSLEYRQREIWLSGQILTNNL